METAMGQHTQQSATELHAFCATCPSPQEVSALLAKLGFHLAFQMEEQRDHSYELPPLPAQFHFKDACGTELLYLAGRDTSLDGEVYPRHASRFWLYAGADPQAFQRARSILVLVFQFIWRDPPQGNAPAQEEVA
jgi:hypothetical protein